MSMAEQGYYGTENSPYANLYSERKVMTPHTSGGSPEPGEYRLRTDLNSGDRIATYELNVGNGVEEAPIFPLSESVGSDIVKVRHVYVPGEGWGFVPLGDSSVFTPAYEEFAFWHNSTRYGWHDSFRFLVDSMEDGDISEYGGETGQFIVDDESNLGFNARDGSNVLIGTDDGALSIDSTSGLDNYPSQGDTFRAWIRLLDADVRGGIRYASQSESSLAEGYIVSLNDANGEVRLRIRDSQGVSTIASSSYNFSTGNWYEVEVQWTTNNEHIVKLFETDGTEEVNLGTTTDSTYTSGGAGFQISSGPNNNEQAAYDYYRIII